MGKSPSYIVFLGGYLIIEQGTLRRNKNQANIMKINLTLNEIYLND